MASSTSYNNAPPLSKPKFNIIWKHYFLFDANPKMIVIILVGYYFNIAVFFLNKRDSISKLVARHLKKEKNGLFT